MDKITYNIALVTHIIGITIMAGATFVDFAGYQRFWKVLPSDRPRGLIIADFLSTLQRFLGIGMLVIILSGVGMMAFLHQVWGQQVWFRIKMGILLLIIINGLVLRRRFGNKLKNLLADETGTGSGVLAKIKSNTTWIQILQVLFFVVIFVLSVFKFN